jgi:hypothetical protein
VGLEWAIPYAALVAILIGYRVESRLMIALVRCMEQQQFQTEAAEDSPKQVQDPIGTARSFQ